jgi:hypothetical protein
MTSLLISLLVFCLIAGLIWWVITLIPLPAPFAQVARIVFAVICVIWAVYFLLGLPHAGLALR